MLVPDSDPGFTGMTMLGHFLTFYEAVKLSPKQNGRKDGLLGQGNGYLNGALRGYKTKWCETMLKRIGALSLI